MLWRWHLPRWLGAGVLLIAIVGAMATAAWSLSDAGTVAAIGTSSDSDAFVESDAAIGASKPSGVSGSSHSAIGPSRFASSPYP